MQSKLGCHLNSHGFFDSLGSNLRGWKLCMVWGVVHYRMGQNNIYKNRTPSVRNFWGFGISYFGEVVPWATPMWVMCKYNHLTFKYIWTNHLSKIIRGGELVRAKNLNQQHQKQLHNNHNLWMICMPCFATTIFVSFVILYISYWWLKSPTIHANIEIYLNPHDLSRLQPIYFE